MYSYLLLSLGVWVGSGVNIVPSTALGITDTTSGLMLALSTVFSLLIKTKVMRAIYTFSFTWYCNLINLCSYINLCGFGKFQILV